MAAPQTIVVLGAGIGGIVVARELRKRISPRHRIVLVDREREHLFAPSLLWLMVGKREAASIKRPLSRLQRKGIEARFGEIERIEPEARRVTVAGETLAADVLVVTLGAELAPEMIPGLVDAGHNLYTERGAEDVRDALATFAKGRIIVLTAAPGYKCPAAPYEAALLIDAYLRKRGVRAAIPIDVYAAEAAPMAVAGPDMSLAVKRLLEAKGIGYHPEHQVGSVDASTRQLAFVGGTREPFDLLAYVPPHRAPRVVRESPLASETGWIAVDRHTMATRFPHVYALGDVVTIPLALGKPLPKAGVFAHREAVVVAKNIAASLEGKTPTERYDGHSECFIEIGDGKAGFGTGNFYAEPKPIVKLRPPGRRWHIAKVLLEQAWLYTKL